MMRRGRMCLSCRISLSGIVFSTCPPSRIPLDLPEQSRTLALTVIEIIEPTALDGHNLASPPRTTAVISFLPRTQSSATASTVHTSLVLDLSPYSCQRHATE